MNRLDAESETFVVGTLAASGAGTQRPAGQGNELDFLISHSLRADGFDASEDGTGRGTPLVAVGWNGDTTPKASLDVMPTMRREQGGEGYGISAGMAVRRLTPEECEALQGFPRGFTNIPGAADGPRYRSLGNSMAVPVMAWIGQRIKEAYAND